MPDSSDIELLRNFCRLGSEPAFADLVQRHINLVYSTALRHVGNTAHAEEISQAVFIILARKAAGLRPDTVLEAWLYETTRLTALSFLRGERRRQLREQEAYMQSTLREPTDASTWDQLSPLLDEAMARLGKKDRAAVVLRFFKEKNLREVATAMNITEAAAQSRVHRALDKLHRYFSRRGVSSTTAIIAGEISSHSVQSAPIGLAKSVSAVAISKSAMASTSTLALVKGALKIMAWTKAKTVIVVGVAALLFATTTATVTIKEIQGHKKYAWEVPQASFGVFYKAPPAVIIVPTKYPKKKGDWGCDSFRGALGIAVTLTDIVEVAYQQDSLRTVVDTDLTSKRYDFFAKLVPPGQLHQNMPMNEDWMTKLQDQITRQFGIKAHLEMLNRDVLVLQPCASGALNFKVSHYMPHGLAIKSDLGN